MKYLLISVAFVISSLAKADEGFVKDPAKTYFQQFKEYFNHKDAEMPAESDFDLNQQPKGGIVSESDQNALEPIHLLSQMIGDDISLPEKKYIGDYAPPLKLESARVRMTNLAFAGLKTPLTFNTEEKVAMTNLKEGTITDYNGNQQLFLTDQSKWKKFVTEKGKTLLILEYSYKEKITTSHTICEPQQLRGIIRRVNTPPCRTYTSYHYRVF